MPINKKKMASLKKQYGAKKGEEVYHALEKQVLKKKKSPKLKKMKRAK